MPAIQTSIVGLSTSSGKPIAAARSAISVDTVQLCVRWLMWISLGSAEKIGSAKAHELLLWRPYAPPLTALCARERQALAAESYDARPLKETRRTPSKESSSFDPRRVIIRI